MKKSIKLLAFCIALMFALSGCSDMEGGDNANDKVELSEEISTEESSNITVLYYNDGDDYCLIVDDYVSFIDTTYDPTSSVGNKDGLEINYGDVYITIQRYPQNVLFDDLDGFYNYLDGDKHLSMIVAENEMTVNNDAIIEQRNQTVKLADGNKVFVGYLYYFVTDNGFYKAMITGSDVDVIEHYKNFVDNMTFNK